MTSDAWVREQSKIYQHAKRELEIGGYFSKESDYGGMLGDAVIELIETFARQGHSGYSAMVTIHLFKVLAEGKPLSAITDNPDDWLEISDSWVSYDGEENQPLWQCRRDSTLFSNDGGKTYYSIEDPLYRDGEAVIYTAKEHASA